MDIEQELINKCLEENLKTYNIHSGERAFVLATGPSSSEMNLTFLENELSVGINYFCKHPNINQIKPKYYIAAHPSIFECTEESDGYIMMRGMEQLKDITRFFFPLNYAKKTMDDPVYKPFKRNYYVCDHSGKKNQSINFGALLPPWSQNVLILSIMLSIHLGAKEIYLVGADNGGLLEMPGRSHFYDKYDYVGDVYSTDFYKEAKYIVLNQLHQLKAYAEANGVSIFTTSKTGSFKLFPYIRYETLFRERILNESKKALNSFNSENYSDTIEIISSIETLNEIPQNLFLTKSMAYHKIGRIDQAKKTILKELTFYPENTLASSFLEQLN